MHSHPFVEICCYSLEEVRIASQYPIQRIELCVSPAEGGLTPSFGLVQEALKISTVPIRVMIRIRGGDFCYSSHELNAMMADIYHLKQLSIDGFVFGGLTETESIDWNALAQIHQACAPFPITFHRAIDRVKDAIEQLNRLAENGCDFVLTSGTKIHVKAGLNVLTHMVHKAEKIQILAGGGVHAYVVPALLHAGIQFVHLSLLTKQTISPDTSDERPQFDPYIDQRWVIDTFRLEQVLLALRST